MLIRSIIGLITFYFGFGGVEVNLNRVIIDLVFISVFLVISIIATPAQANSSLWLRVFTSEYSIIEVNSFSLVLEQDQIITAQFKTVFSRPEPVPGKPGLKYQTRIDSIQFNINDSHYRISESKFLDAAGNVALSFSPENTAEWRSLSGRTANLLFRAAGQLRPFGSWKVQSYRYASGEPASDQDPRELRSLVGSDVLLNLDMVVVGKETCKTPIFNAKTITDEEFSNRIGSSFRSLGLPWDKLDIIHLVCNAGREFPPQTLILRPPDGSILMLWDGVLLHMERTKNIFLP